MALDAGPDGPLSSVWADLFVNMAEKKDRDTLRTLNVSLVTPTAAPCPDDLSGTGSHAPHGGYR